MAEPFLAEIRIMSFNFPPKGWAFCNGQLLPINQNQALFSLLGTTYGGNGSINFALPSLMGCTPIHTGGGHTLGEKAGEQTHTLTISEVPTHTHLAYATSSTGESADPTTTEILAKSTVDEFATPANLVAMSASQIGNIGGSQAHLNMQPFLALSFCIALQGIFPSSS